MEAPLQIGKSLGNRGKITLLRYRVCIKQSNKQTDPAHQIVMLNQQHESINNKIIQNYQLQSMNHHHHKNHY